MYIYIYIYRHTSVYRGIPIRIPSYIYIYVYRVLLYRGAPTEAPAVERVGQKAAMHCHGQLQRTEVLDGVEDCLATLVSQQGL